ncbi:MAG TPA: hypothetical protein VES68_03750 [Candidatus Sulfotelmatobacter sp.]|nr:hypothetical protein [Candidatus Sulfotelmatobacter sp.]
MSEKDIPSSLQTIEIFAEDEQTGLPLAMTMDPDATDRERLKLIVKAQVDRVDPKTIFCNIGGVYDTISSDEFSAVHNQSDVEVRDFVEEITDVLKGPFTSDIILSDPPAKVRK